MGTRETDKSIDLFIKHIVEEDYAKAKEDLQDVVNDKIKDRIRACEKRLGRKSTQGN